MKRLQQSEQVLIPANQAALPPMVIIITDPTTQYLPFPISDLARYQHNLQTYNPQPHESIPQPNPGENRLRRLMQQERKLLLDTFNDFGAATRSFIGTLVSWIIWRILLPLTVLSVMWMSLASTAELTI